MKLPKFKKKVLKKLITTEPSFQTIPQLDVSGDKMVQRQQFVADLMVRGISRAKIVSICMQQFSVSDRTVTDYIKRVREYNKSEYLKAAPYRREETLARLYDELREIRSAKAYGALVTLEKLICRVEGLEQAQEINITAQVQHTEAEQMTLEECVETAEVATRAFDRARKKGLISPENGVDHSNLN